MTPGVVKLREPADTIVSRFSAAWVQDKAIERKERRFLAATIVLGLVAVASVFIAGVAHTPRLLAVAAVAAVFAVAAGYRWRAYRRLDIDDRKLQTVLRVLKIMRADIPRDERVALSVDLRNYDATTAKPPAVAKFTDDWFRLTARLADGNVVTLMLTDRIKRKVKHRGTRFACHSSIRVAMRLAKHSRPAAPIVAALQARRARAGHRLARATADSERRVVVALQSNRVTSLTDLPAGDALLQALAWVYGGLAAARRPA